MVLALWEYKVVKYRPSSTLPSSMERSGSPCTGGIGFRSLIGMVVTRLVRAMTIVAMMFKKLANFIVGILCGVRKWKCFELLEDWFGY
jgi:hypothetical protein